MMRDASSRRTAGGALGAALFALVLLPNPAPGQTVTGSASSPTTCLYDPPSIPPASTNLNLAWEVPASVTPGQTFQVRITSASAPVFYTVPFPEVKGPVLLATNATPEDFSINLATSSLPKVQSLTATGPAGGLITLRFEAYVAASFTISTSMFCTPGFDFATIPILGPPTPTPTLMPTTTPTPTPTKKKAKKVKKKKAKVKKAKKLKKAKK